MITIIKLRSLFARLARKGMAQVFADWEMLVGFEASARADAIQIGPDIETVAEGLDRKHLVVETQVEKGSTGMGSIYFAFPNTLVIEVIADLLMIPEPARITKAKEGLSENDVEAFREMANLLCGSWNRVFQDFERDLRISQSVDDLKVWTGESGDGALISCFGEGRVAYVTLEVDCAGKSFPALMALPFDVAVEVAEEFYAGAA